MSGKEFEIRGSVDLSAFGIIEDWTDILELLEWFKKVMELGRKLKEKNQKMYENLRTIQ